MKKEPSTVSGKLKRYAKVSKTVGSVTTKIAGRKLIGKNDEKKNADLIFNALGGLKGPLMKVAQLLSTIPDALPKGYSEKLQQLQADAPSMGWLFVKRRMSNELGKNWIKKFKRFEKNAIKAASLGQVHRACINKQTLACKLQYPDMLSVVNADLRQIKLIFSLYKTWDKTINTSDIYDEISVRLLEELDYEREQKNMLLYAKILSKEKQINVPIPIKTHSTKRLITMTWLDGEPLMLYKKSKSHVKNEIALALFKAWYIPFYRYGIIHGDPHPGNYQVNYHKGSVKINLLDFGCIRVFSPKFVKGVIDLYKAMRDDNNALAVEAYKAWGFKKLSNEVIDVLNMWANYVYGPLLVDKKRFIQNKNTGKNGKDIAKEVYKKLKKLGGVTPPREFVLIDRAAVGLGSVFMHLNAKLNWHQLLEEMIENFDENTLKIKQEKVLKEVGLK